MVVASDGGPRVVTHRPLPRVLAAARAAVLGFLPLLVLVIVTGAIFSSELLGGPIYFGRDTTTFYYPLTRWAADELKAGRLPLWTPTIFGGYPIVADGEIGLLHPLQVALLLTLDTPLAYAWMRAVHYLIAALGLYLYARTLGANSLGAAIGGLAFAYGSFMVGHLQHDNILRSAAWLPWLLLGAERALRAAGPRRLLWLAVGALVLALEGLGTHIQPVLLSLTVAGFALFIGPLGRASIGGTAPSGVSRAAALGRLVHDVRATLTRRGLGGRSADWAVSRALLGLGLVGLGLGLAAVQLVPLYQLGLRSIRPTLASYAYATSFAVSPPQILTLIFPTMFNFDVERHWALWAPHESTLYVGVAPLLLAVLGLAFVRGRAVAFYGILALVSLVLVFGDYLPVKSYTVVWSLPGFGYLRAPARFNLLLSLALAVLAALGTTWLARRARQPGRSRALETVLGAMLLLPLGLGLTIGAVRWWLYADPVTATDLFQRGLQTSKENGQLGPWHIYYGLLEFTRPDNPRTALGLALLAATPALLRLWLARPRLEALWGASLLLLTAADLWFFATSFYPRAYPADLTPSTPAVTALTDTPEPARTFVEPVLNQRFGANQLAGAGIETVNGYSSLEPPRFSDYWWSIVHQDNLLLDLFNVRYVLAPRREPPVRTYEGAAYHPYDRLMSGTPNNPSGQETFRVEPTYVTAIALVGAVEGLGEVPAGTPVAEITLIGPADERQTVTVRAGVDLAEYRAAEPGLPMADYVGPQVVWAGPAFTPPLAPPGEPVRLYGSTLRLAQPFETVAVEMRTVTPSGRLHLHGLGLRAPDGGVRSIRAIDKAKYRAVVEDGSAVLLENTAARPRVWLVPDAVTVSGPATPERLIRLAWDPSRQVVVEGLPPEEIHAGGPAGPIGEARLVAYSPTRIEVQVDLTVPGYLVLADRFDEGWRAAVDETDVRTARANGVARAVAVPAGAHLVTFTYAPYALWLGLGVSVVAAVAWIGVLAVGLVGVAGVRRRPRRPAGAA